ncbi:6,7-dimethyl-8-ribityllumazine synthase [uncultured archaeon]|nr:6,7-dimethyl-8-ribityllumazine synthase [uncultured archaeon]
MDLSKQPKAIAMAVADFNDEITGRMLAQAQEEAKKSGAEVVKTVHVPGAYDLPLIVATLLEREDIDAAVALGAVVKGETGHDEVVVSTCAKQLSDLSIEFGKPVGMGIIGPGVTHAQAQARADEYARRAVQAALKLVDALAEAQED